MLATTHKEGTELPLGGQLGWKGAPARSKLELSLRCAWAMMRRKVISAPKDSIGVVIFNTVSCFNPHGPGKRQVTELCSVSLPSQEESTVSRLGHSGAHHTQQPVPLAQINAKMIKDLQKILRGEPPHPS